MTAEGARGRRLAQILFIVLLGMIVVAILYSALRGSPGPWLVPEEAKQLMNPLQMNPAALQPARTIYKDKCANCHGESGKGDGEDASRYDPVPTNFTDRAKMDSATDGELFYKISEGKKPMPVFKAKLTEQQRWELVLLIRSFAKRGPDETPAR
jgi:mono/diheme cytochrome c family protein